MDIGDSSVFPGQGLALERAPIGRLTLLRTPARGAFATCEFDRVLPQIVENLDSVDHRIELARAVLSLRDRGRVSPVLAAIAVVELDREESIIFTNTFAEAISVLAGDQRTPSGLLVAAG